jgi:hypothetical protein
MNLFPARNCVPVIERIVRMRSCYMYQLKARRWLWHARLMLWCERTFGVYDCNYWIVTPVLADKLCRNYRNWLGENRLGA